MKEKNYDVLVIAGTTEARQVIEILVNEKKRILASVATDLGQEMLLDYPVAVHVGRLDLDGFVGLIKEYSIQKIVDASHPFAKIVTETVREAAAICRIPYERYERPELSYDYDRIILVGDARDAADALNGLKGNVLLTTGVNTAGLYAGEVKDGASRLYIRVLDTKASYEGCRAAGYPDDHVYGMMPPYSLEDNLALIDETDAKVMVSKDSGKTGGVDIKVEACRQRGIPLVLIRRS